MSIEPIVDALFLRGGVNNDDVRKHLTRILNTRHKYGETITPKGIIDELKISYTIEKGPEGFPKLSTDELKHLELEQILSQFNKPDEQIINSAEEIVNNPGRKSTLIKSILEAYAELRDDLYKIPPEIRRATIERITTKNKKFVNVTPGFVYSTINWILNKLSPNCDHGLITHDKLYHFCCSYGRKMSITKGIWHKNKDNIENYFELAKVKVYEKSDVIAFALKLRKIQLHAYKVRSRSILRGYQNIEIGGPVYNNIKSAIVDHLIEHGGIGKSVISTIVSREYKGNKEIE